MIYRLLAVLLFVGCSSIKQAKEDYKSGSLFTAKKHDKRFFHHKWVKNLDSIEPGSSLSINVSSPYIFQQLLFQGALDGDFNAYSLDNGRLLWSKKEDSSIASQASIFKENVIYGTINGRLISRDSLTGELKYDVDLGASIQATPTFYKGRVLIHTRDHRLVCLDASTGKILWSFKRSIPYSSTIQGYSEPLGHKNQVFVGFADGYIVSVALDDGMLIWEKKLSSSTKFVDVDASPRINDGNLYIGSLSGRFSKLNPTNGNLITQYDFSASAAPLFIKDTMYIPTIDGYVVKVDGVGKSRQEVKVVLDQNSPVTDLKVWKGYIVGANTKGRLFKLDPESLEVKESFWLGSELSAVYGNLQVREDTLALMSSRSRLYVFE